MLIRFKDLATLALVATDGSRHRVKDVFLDDRSFRILYVVADMGGWFGDRTAVVSVERFGAPDVAATEWPCTLDEAALEERPEAGPEGGSSEGRTLPDVMVAPAGGLVSPRLIHGSVGDEDLPIPAKADPKGRLGEGAHLRSAAEWTLDTEVVARDGAAGRLMGLIFESEDWTLRYLVIETGGDGLPQNQRVIEAARISGVDFERRTVDVDMAVEDVQKALDLHEVDGVEGKWYNKVLAYYGLQS